MFKLFFLVSDKNSKLIPWTREARNEGKKIYFNKKV